MNQDQIDQQLKDHYHGLSPRPETTQHLLSAAVQGGENRRSRPVTSTRPGRPGQWLGLAAGVALLLVGTGYVAFLLGASTHPAPLRPAVQGDALPDLVAVRLYAEWCGRCPAVTPVFDEMREKYGNRPVVFLTLDLTDENTKRQSKYHAAALGIEWVYEEPFESGMIKLLDRRQHKVLAVLIDGDQRPVFDGALAQALPGIN